MYFTFMYFMLIYLFAIFIRILDGIMNLYLLMECLKPFQQVPLISLLISLQLEPFSKLFIWLGLIVIIIPNRFLDWANLSLMIVSPD